MKIDPSPPSPLLRSKAQSHKAEKSAAGADTTASATSHAGNQTAAPDSVAAPFSAGRVADIRQAIADGRLQIDADKIAGRLLEDVRQLLAKHRTAK